MPSKSKRQARMMAAVAHNPRFAKKVGIPQSVGQEFYSADRRVGRFAEGGKVRTIKRISEFLKDKDIAMNLFGEDSPRYHQTLKDYGWDPEMDKDDVNFLAGYGDGNLWGWKPDSPHLRRMNELIQKYGLRPSRTPTWRGLEVPPDVVLGWKPGDVLRSDRPSSISVERDVADEFANLGSQEGERVPTVLRIAPSERLALPVPNTGASELVMPSGDAGRLGVNKIRYNPRTDTYEVDVETVPHPGFAEGGALPSSKGDDEPWYDTYLKRPLSGLTSMWSGLDPETGEVVIPPLHNLMVSWNAAERRKKGLPKQKDANLGIADEFMSLPALGGLVGLPVPEFAQRASDRADNTRMKVRDAMGLDAPHGFAENIAESAGVMAGQMPVPGSVARKLKVLKEGSKAGKIVGPAAEWFSPTVVPKAENYVKGTLFGGTLGGAADYLEDHLDESEREARNKKFIEEAMAEVLAEEAGETGSDETDDEALAQLGYAEGGRVGVAKQAIGSLRRALQEADPEDVQVRKAKIDQALSTLRGVRAPEPARVHLNTSAMGLADAAADANPARRRQRFGDYERNVLDLLEGNAPALTPQHVPEGLAATIRDIPAPPPYKPTQVGIHGTMTPERFQLEVLKKKVGMASGGKVTGYAPAPQAQKLPQATGTPATDPRGAPLSQSWYENYGQGPEHLFLGDRKTELHDMWAPQHNAPAPDFQQRPDGSWLPAAGIIGFSLYDQWKKKQGENAGADASQQAFWQNMHDSAANTADTDAWVNKQLEDYADTMPIPHMNDDGTMTYIQPPERSFWENMHRSASDTSSTDAWVNQQLEDYAANMPVPHINEDGTVTNKAPSQPQQGLLNRTWQGAGGAYDLVGGLDQGGIGGYGRALSGAGNLYGSIAGPNAASGLLGKAGGTLGGLGSLYSGIQQGGVGGYTQAAAGALQTANTLGLNVGALGSVAGKAIPIVGGALSAKGAYDAAKVGDKKGAATQGAMAGASIGSVIPGIGTAVGAVIGGLVGVVGAAFGNKEQASEAAYGAHKKLDQSAQIRGWTPDQVGGAVFETIKSHTKSGNIKKFPDVSEMFTAMGITKDAHKNIKQVQAKMGDFINGVITTAQQSGVLPTDPVQLRQLDGQQIFHKIVAPAMAAKFKEVTGQESKGWNSDRSGDAGARMHNLFADWTDWTVSRWGKEEEKKPAQAQPKNLADMIRMAKQGVMHAEGGLASIH